MDKAYIENLVKNKAELIKQKKILPIKHSMPIVSDSITLSPSVAFKSAIKADSDSESVIVDVVANLSGWMDMDDDVILRGAYSKSISDKSPDKFPFLKDHKYSVDSFIADTLKVYTEEMTARQLGYNSDKSGQALVFKGRVRKGYDSSMYEKYKNGLIKQHSIGLRYIKPDLAVNDAQYDEEFKVWQRYFSQVINEDKAIEKGYFWAISEIAVIENSAVVWGSNSMTPTIAIEEEKEAAKSTSMLDTLLKTL